MRAREANWFELTASDVRAGDRYRFVLDDGSKIPDPASRYQPDALGGLSEVIDPFAYQWQVTTWQGRPWGEAVVYELHLAAFTPEGTYCAAASKLDVLVELGITAIQIMRAAGCPGLGNWGDDGVLLYAPDSSYGRPEELKGLIDAAHARGLLVLLDVAYNHFGPDGNYPAKLAPRTANRVGHTRCELALEYDEPNSLAVREFVIQNALYWIEEFNVDGLRLDAAHAIADDGAEDLLHDLARRVCAAAPGRCVHLILKNERCGTSGLTSAPSLRERAGITAVGQRGVRGSSESR